MSNLAKLGIVVILAVAVAAVVIAKRSGNSAATATPAASGGPVCCTGGAAVTPANGAATQPATQPARAALPRLVDLGAGKCIPCKRMAPILEELKTELAGKLQVEFIDVWVNPNAGQAYGINIIPTQIFYDASGTELSRHEGFMPRQDILGRFKEHGVDFTKAP